MQSRRHVWLLTLSIALIATIGSGAVRAERCITIGTSIFCGTNAAHKNNGRSVIFNRGPVGALNGSILVRKRYRGLYATQVLPLPRPPSPGPNAPPPGSYIDFSRARDFGAFEFPFVNKRGGTVAGARAGRLGPSLPSFKR